MTKAFLTRQLRITVETPASLGRIGMKRINAGRRESCQCRFTLEIKPSVLNETQEERRLWVTDVKVEYYKDAE